MTRQQILKDPSFRFNVKEFVCPHIYERFGSSAWNYIDKNLLEVILWIRKTLNRPMTINNWGSGKSYSQRGMRCNLCQEVKDKKQAYLSAHVLGQGVDFDVQGMTAMEVRKWIDDHKDQLPHKIRLEKTCNGVECSWVHLDVRNETAEKIVYFNG
jgi:hypothetical protein